MRPLIVILTSTLLLHAGAAHAKASSETMQSYERTWNTAIRFVRVDMGLKLVEKDVDAGYIVFDYVSSDGGKSSSAGSVELVRLDSKVRINVQLPKMPHFHEDVLLQGIVKKLREDYGESAPPPKAVPPATSPQTTPPASRGSNDL